MKTSKRIAYLDLLRWFGMFLVFYGHFLSRIPTNELGPLFWQKKLIYSFHMPLFFFLAGIFWSSEKALSRNYLLNRIRSLFIPAIFWSIVFLPMYWVTVPREEFFRLLAQHPMGKTSFFTPGWFLICLMMVELVLAGVSRWINITKQFTTKIIATISAFILGFLIFKFQTEIQLHTGFDPSFWHIREVFTAIGFLLSGSLMKSYITEKERGGSADWLMLSAGLISLFLLFDVNQGNGNETSIIIDMASSNYGNYFWFLVNAFSGIIFSLALFRIIRFESKTLQFSGENSIIIYGLSGFNFNVFDQYFLGLGLFPSNPLLFSLCIIGYCLVWQLAYLPFAKLLKRNSPFLVGSR